MENITPYKIKTISEYHTILGISKPQHPLISLISLENFKPVASNTKISVVFDFYMVSLKRNFTGNINYLYGNKRMTLMKVFYFLLLLIRFFRLMLMMIMQVQGGCCLSTLIFYGIQF